MAAQPISRSRKLLFYGITIVLLLAVIELCCRAYYYQALNPPHPFASVQLIRDIRSQIDRHRNDDLLIKRLRNNQYLVRPHFSKEQNDEIDRECRAANHAVYQPWVEFSFMDFRSTYVNVVDHRRVSIPYRSDSAAGDRSDSAAGDRPDSAARNPLRIYFLGGSTTYGFDVTDAETIPSAFVRAYREKYPGGPPIRVFNLGMPFYYSYQELILLADRLFRDEHPDMIVMLDGLNDCYGAGAAIDRVPVPPPNTGDRLLPGEVVDTARRPKSYNDLPRGISADSGCSLVAARYLDNIRHAHQLTEINHIPLYCFWQPVPYYHYPNRANDPICTHTEQPRFGKIYPIIRDSAAHIPYLFFLGDLLQQEKGLPFVDEIHYSPSFSRSIAEEMLNRIDFGKKWKFQ